MKVAVCDSCGKVHSVATTTGAVRIYSSDREVWVLSHRATCDNCGGALTIRATVDVAQV